MLAYSGRGAFMVRPLNLSTLALEIGRLLEASVSKKAVLKYACDPHLPFIDGDAAQLHQVLINLITNASDALGDNPGVITVSTRCVHATRDYLSRTFVDDDLEEGPFVCLEVSDTGCGMDAATRARIFDPFFSTKFAGRGLGLSATLGIVRGHRGAIKVYTEPGRGTTFKVLFPVAPQAGLGSREAADEQEDRVVAGWRGTGVILVADDEEVAREVARESFESHGFRVILAVNGKEAVDKFRDHAGEISAVLLDLTMPVMSGEEAFREIQGIRSNVPIVLSSGYTEQDAVKRFSGSGPAGFVQKPYAIMELAKKFHSLLHEVS
jgi:CheY-like chemotaxis protein